MPTKYTRIATDKDVLKFIKLLIEGAARGDLIMKGSLDFKDWLNKVGSDDILLDKEKDRIKMISFN